MEQLTDLEFRENLDYLNAITSDYFPWKPTTAMKTHIDEYGHKIEKKEIYYKRENSAYNSEIKLSKSSMEKLLIIIVNQNDTLKSIGKIIKKNKNLEIREALVR